MPESREPIVNGVILAGGRSRRMAGSDKRFSRLQGQGLLQRVIDRAAPQVSTLVLNAPDPERLAGFSLPVVCDRLPGFRGPLTGLYSALAWCADHSPCRWLAVFACDTPFLPRNLVARLRNAAENAAADIAVSVVEGQVQPTASLWHSSLLAELERAVLEQQMAGFREFLKGRPWIGVDWHGDDRRRFFNINSPEDLVAAEQLAGELAETGEIRPC